MSQTIKRLSTALANKIAAGEVVLRPSSVVKELLENAVDAGAATITLQIKEGGKSLIQVTDDGKGMSPEDAVLAFERHATSKIEELDDLFAINTMGFRGEALASIAAVARVELKTRTAESDVAHMVLIEGSEIKKNEACQSAVGSQVDVRQLFFNVPARRKFLKSDAVETRHIYDEFIRIALAHPELKMNLFTDNKEVYRLPATNLRKRICHVFAKKYDERLVPVAEDTDIVRIDGFIGKPEFAKKNRGEQFFYVNDRFIKSPYLHHAVTGAYHEFIEEKQQPLYILKLYVDPTKIDINVHPSKHEVKFEDERYIYQIVQAAVKHALAKFSVTPTLDFESDPAFNRHEFFGNPTKNKTEIENPVESRADNTFLKRNFQSPTDKGDWQEFYKQQELDRETVGQVELVVQPADESLFKGYKPYQVAGKYVIASVKSGFLVIDQRRAHLRIKFEQLVKSKDNVASQALLYPETISLTQADVLLITEQLDMCNRLGFDIEVFGKDAIIVRSLPSDFKLESLKDFIEDFVNDLNNNIHRNDQWQELVYKKIARQQAIPYGKKLGITEMESLIEQLFACDNPQMGLVKDHTFLTFSGKELEDLFSSPSSSA